MYVKVWIENIQGCHSSDAVLIAPVWVTVTYTLIN